MAERPYALSIAGIDPSGGAGLFADVKTFEQLEVYGLGIASSNTIQTENEFFVNQWIDRNFIIEGVRRIMNEYPVKALKVGIIEDLNLLQEITGWVKSQNQDIVIVWDPVIKSTTNFDFNDKWRLTEDVFMNIDIVTPNVDEWNYLQLIPREKLNCAVLLKGGHSEKQKGYDQLWWNHEWKEIPPQTTSEIFEKHGSGCVFSAALTAMFSQGYYTPDACKGAKEYTEKFLASSPNKLGYHNGEIALHITR